MKNTYTWMFSILIPIDEGMIARTTNLPLTILETVHIVFFFFIYIYIGNCSCLYLYWVRSSQFIWALNPFPFIYMLQNLFYLVLTYKIFDQYKRNCSFIFFIYLYWVGSSGVNPFGVYFHSFTCYRIHKINILFSIDIQNL